MKKLIISLLLFFAFLQMQAQYLTNFVVTDGLYKDTQYNLIAIHDEDGYSITIENRNSQIEEFKLVRLDEDNFSVAFLNTLIKLNASPKITKQDSATIKKVASSLFKELSLQDIPKSSTLTPKSGTIRVSKIVPVYARVYLSEKDSAPKKHEQEKYERVQNFTGTIEIQEVEIEFNGGCIASIQVVSRNGKLIFKGEQRITHTSAVNDAVKTLKNLATLDIKSASIDSLKDKIAAITKALNSINSSLKNGSSVFSNINPRIIQSQEKLKTIQSMVISYDTTDSISNDSLQRKLDKLSSDLSNLINEINNPKLNFDYIRFTNKYSIGFSSKNNYTHLKNVLLFGVNTKDDTLLYIYLGDVIDYVPNFALNTRDFSPNDQIKKFLGGQTKSLYKAETQKLFEGVIYSDILGLGLANNINTDTKKEFPNGLIQTEINKNIYLSTNPVQVKFFNKSECRYLNKSSFVKNLRQSGYGGFQYIRPSIVLSKIEQNNYALLLNSKNTIDSATTPALVHKLYTSPIQLLNYQNISLGSDLNLFYWEMPEYKFTFYFNGGFRFGRTIVMDSLVRLTNNNQIERTGVVPRWGVSYFLFSPEFSLHILPEERFSFSITNRINWFYPAFSDISLTPVNLNLFNHTYNIDRLLNTFELKLSVKTGDNGTIFTRWRFNQQFNNISENYHQIQVGYAFYVLKNIKK